MDSHAIPQNVTDFQFHLIGDMTLKQFGYFGAGLASAYITFVIIGTKFPFIAWPLMAIFVLTGAALAFLPINERPLDHWIKAYFKAIMSPTKGEWKVKGVNKDDLIYQQRLAIYLNNLNVAPTISQDMPKLATLSEFNPNGQTEIKPGREKQVVQSQVNPKTFAISPVPPPQATQPVSQPVSQVKAQPSPVQAAAPIPKSMPTQQPQAPEPEKPLPSPSELKKEVEYAQQAQQIQTKILDTQKQMQKIREKAARPGEDTARFNADFQNILFELQTLNNQATDIASKLASATKVNAQPANVTVIPVSPTPPEPKQVILTSTPNVINGIVTDAIGNYLDGVIVVTHDKQQLPVRALKTNKLGQFIAVTPLPNGTYTITLEKENFSFNVYKIELNGQVMTPLSIAAKKGGV